MRPNIALLSVLAVPFSYDIYWSCCALRERASEMYHSAEDGCSLTYFTCNEGITHLLPHEMCKFGSAGSQNMGHFLRCDVHVIFMTF